MSVDGNRIFQSDRGGYESEVSLHDLLIRVARFARQIVDGGLLMEEVDPSGVNYVSIRLKVGVEGRFYTERMEVFYEPYFMPGVDVLIKDSDNTQHMFVSDDEIFNYFVSEFCPTGFDQSIYGERGIIKFIKTAVGKYRAG
ncbi:MAG: hypothetical protein R3B38_00010 [Patescibacteria group bacterium]